MEVFIPCDGYLNSGHWRRIFDQYGREKCQCEVRLGSLTWKESFGSHLYAMRKVLMRLFNRHIARLLMIKLKPYRDHMRWLQITGMNIARFDIPCMDSRLCKIAVSMNWRALGAIPDMHQTEDVALIAIKRNTQALSMVGHHLLMNQEFIGRVLKEYGHRDCDAIRLIRQLSNTIENTRYQMYAIRYHIPRDNPTLIIE
jgi:hypothetical protein